MQGAQRFSRRTMRSISHAPNAGQAAVPDSLAPPAGANHALRYAAAMRFPGIDLESLWRDA